MFRAFGVAPVFPTLEDAIDRSSILVGSPQQIVEKVHRYHARFGHEVMHLQADGDGLTDEQHRARWSSSSPTSPRAAPRDPQQAVRRPDPVHGPRHDPGTAAFAAPG